MKIIIIFSVLTATAFGNPLLYYDVQSSVVPYVRLLTGAPLGPDGRVVDTPEVSAVKAQHEAAQINQKITLANEAAKSTDPMLDLTTDSATIIDSSVLTSDSGAPLDSNGQVIDTPEVTKAKADHAAAHVNEKMKLAQENAKLNDRSVDVIVPEAAVVSVPIISEILYPPIIS